MSKERSYQVMVVWDEHMAATAVKFRKDCRARRIVVLAGSGHVDRGIGIAARAKMHGAGKVVTVHIDVGVDPEKAVAEPTADFIVILK